MVTSTRCCNGCRPCARPTIQAAMEHAKERGDATGRNQLLRWNNDCWQITAKPPTGQEDE